ncbi:MAG: hypothetical protein QMC67_09225 [Candidatus Wallbacteria bacterium]
MNCNYMKNYIKLNCRAAGRTRFIFENNRGSALMVVMGILFVIFIFGFGYVNYLNGQVYMIAHEKDYEFARLIVKSAVLESMENINFESGAFIDKLKKMDGRGPVLSPYNFYEPKISSIKKIVEEKFNDKTFNLKVIFEPLEIIPFAENTGEGEKFVRFNVKASFNSGLMAASEIYEVTARLAALIDSKNSNNVKGYKLIPERVSAVINKPEALLNGKYYGICVYTGPDYKIAKETAAKARKFRGILVNPNGDVIADKMISAGRNVLSFGPLILK